MHVIISGQKPVPYIVYKYTVRMNLRFIWLTSCIVITPFPLTRAWYGLGQTYEMLKMPFYCLYYYKQVQSHPNPTLKKKKCTRSSPISEVFLFHEQRDCLKKTALKKEAF